MNIKGLLGDARLKLETSPTPRLDTEVLLGHVLSFSRASLYANATEAVPADKLDEFLDTIEELERLIGDPKVKRVLSRLEETVVKPVVMNRDYDQGAGMLLPDLSKMRRLSRLLKAKTWLDAVKGRNDEAVKSIVLGFRLADAQKTEPVLITQLVRLACLKIQMRSLVAVLPKLTLKDQEAKLIKQTLAGIDFHGPMKLSIQGERIIFGGWVFDKGFSQEELRMLGMDGASWFYAAYGSSLGTPLRNLDNASYLASLGMCERAFDRDASDVTGDRLSLELRSKIKPYAILSRMLVPVLGRVVEKTNRSRTERDCALILLDCWEFHGANGRYPKTLSELKRRISKDPFSGKDYLYKASKDGITVYSVGSNKTDDGGAVNGRNVLDYGHRMDLTE